MNKQTIKTLHKIAQNIVILFSGILLIYKHIK